MRPGQRYIWRVACAFLGARYEISSGVGPIIIDRGVDRRSSAPVGLAHASTSGLGGLPLRAHHADGPLRADHGTPFLAPIRRSEDRCPRRRGVGGPGLRRDGDRRSSHAPSSRAAHRGRILQQCSRGANGQQCHRGANGQQCPRRYAPVSFGQGHATSTSLSHALSHIDGYLPPRRNRTPWGPGPKRRRGSARQANHSGGHQPDRHGHHYRLDHLRQRMDNHGAAAGQLHLRPQARSAPGRVHLQRRYQPG